MNYYLARDKTPEYRSATLESAATTATVWGPRTGNKFVIENINIGANLGAVINFYKGTTTSGPESVATFVVGGSSYACIDGLIDGSTSGYNLYATTDVGSTGGQYLFVTGFEDTVDELGFYEATA